MSRRGLQPLGVVVSFFGILKPLHLLSPRKQFTERIIHYPNTNRAIGRLAARRKHIGICEILRVGNADLRSKRHILILTLICSL